MICSVVCRQMGGRGPLSFCVKRVGRDWCLKTVDGMIELLCTILLQKKSFWKWHQFSRFSHCNLSLSVSGLVDQSLVAIREARDWTLSKCLMWIFCGGRGKPRGYCNSPDVGGLWNCIDGTGTPVCISQRHSTRSQEGVWLLRWFRRYESSTRGCCWLSL